MVFLIILLVLNAFLSPLIAKEHFIEGTDNGDALSLEVFKRLGRNLDFPNYGRNGILTASQRASLDTSIKTYPNGKCTAVASPIPKMYDSYSIIREDNVFYKLRKGCFALQFESLRFYDDRSIVISFKVDTDQDLDNVIKFALVNPLYVEFCNNMRDISVAYIPKFRPNNGITFSIFNNRRIPRNTVDVIFNMAVPLADGSCDPAFNYSMYSQKNKEFTAADFSDIQDKVINMWVYYLDEPSGPFQKIGSSLPISNNTQDNSIQIYDKDYQTSIGNDQYAKSKYEFMNNLSLMYLNNIVPVLTFSFDIVVTIDKVSSLVNTLPFNNVLSCYVNNQYPVANCNNNIMQVIIKPGNGSANNKFDLILMTGSGANCDINMSELNCAIELPYLSPKTSINVTVTLGQKQRHIYAQWFDPNSGDRGKKIMYSKYQNVSVSAPYNVCETYDNTYQDDNFMTQIFSSTTLNPRPRLENIYLAKNPAYVSRINSVSLGYINFNNLYGTSL